MSFSIFLTTIKRWKLSIFFILLWGSYFGLFWRKALYLDEFGNLVAGHINIWGDWAAHMTMSSALANRSLWLTDSPFLLGAPFRYPFGVNWLTAIITNLGVPFFTSLVVLSLVLTVSSVVALLFFFYQLLRSEKLAILASSLFLLNGGMGWWFFLQDILGSNTPLQTLLHPTQQYTRMDQHNIKFINVIDSMLIPQRAFALGFPVALICLGILIPWITRNEKRRSWHVILPGILLGFLPLLHTHSFLMVFILLATWSCLYLLQKNLPLKQLQFKQLLKLARPLILLAGIVGVISIPLIGHYYLGPSSGSFISFLPGWYANEFGVNWLGWWFLNWGVMPVMAVLGWVYLFATAKTTQGKIQAALVYLPFFLIFMAANIWKFQPFIWDNTKLFVWSALGFSALAAVALKKIWTSKYKAVVFILGPSLILSGLIDAYWIQRHDLHSYVLFTKEELRLAEWTQHNTSPEAIWLTGDQHNNWLYNLTGRQSVLTYRGWLWTHGYEYLETEQNVRAMFHDPQENQELVQQKGISYILVGPNERSEWGADEGQLNQLYPVLKETNHYTIYATN